MEIYKDKIANVLHGNHLMRISASLYSYARLSRLADLPVSTLIPGCKIDEGVTIRCTCRRPSVFPIPLCLNHNYDGMNGMSYYAH